MEIAVRRESHLVIVDMAGEIDVNAVSRIRDTFGDLTKAASPQIVVNLAGATYIDSSGLGILMAARREALFEQSVDAEKGRGDALAKRVRPLARRRLNTLRPALVAIRFIKPCSRLRCFFLG